MAGLLKEAWLSIVMEQYSQSTDWMNLIDNDLSSLVENDQINLAEAGVDPEVLVNNTTYPIPVQERTDSPLALPLDWFDTKNTVVRNVTQKQIAYDKMASVTRGHARQLRLKTAGKASHAYTPAQEGDFTPVLPTTGGNDGNGIKIITEADVFKLAGRFDDVDAPDDRVLVLHPKMWNQLIENSPTLKEQRYRGQQGRVERVLLELAGFQIARFRSDAVFNKSTGVKKAWNAAAAPSTDTISSFAFVRQEGMKCLGTDEMFYRPKEMNPEHRGDLIGFQKFFLAMPMRNKYIGAIYGAAV